MAVTYQDWLKSVKQFLASRRPDVRFDHLDPNHLYSSFQSGISPIDFVQRGNFRLNPAVPPPAAPHPHTVQPQSSSTNGWLIALVVIALTVVTSCIGCGVLLRSAQEANRRELASIPTCSQVQSSLAIGMTTSQVTEAIGEPHSVQEMNHMGVTRRYWYYDCRDGRIQLVFEYGLTLTSINRY